MIADKLIPSFYIIELDGDAIQSIIPGDFGIAKITIASRDFQNDLYALSALSTAMGFIALNPDLDINHANERIDYNPEFFPSLTPKQDDADNQEEEEEQVAITPSGSTVVMLTRNFDQFGDFVEARWNIASDQFNIVGRVAVNPDGYLKQKALDIPDIVYARQIDTNPGVSLH